MKHFRSMTIGFLGGALAATTLAAGAQQTFRPAINSPTLAAPDAALKAELQALKTRLDAAEKKIDGVELAGKATATKGFELQSKLTSLQTAFDKHQHYQNLVQTTGGKQLLSTNPTSPPTSKCKLNPSATGDSWIAKYNC